ncbi:MAG TPA: pantoate--beta-alanine ligase [Nocardioidaceae bacterium]|nr:pantoate--beta-alanine ligase [Nocardioidaceae bacterium]
MTPTLVHTRGQLDAALGSARDAGGRFGAGVSGDGRVVLVPTMGALHEGHAALIRSARELGSRVVVWIFVNPTQFAPGEDFERYPRTLDDDLVVCADAGADAVFAPSVEEVYPDGDPRVYVDSATLGAELEGAVRPGHFRGVLTVVAKMLALVRPDAAVFGEKDYQQLVLIRRMVLDLCLPVEVHGHPTVRESDGLALSSRNRYLSPEDRQTALALSRSLRAGRDAAAAGQTAVLAAAHAVLDETPHLALDYLALRSPDLGPAPETGAARLLVAARLETARLIDNVPLTLGDPPDRS